MYYPVRDAPHNRTRVALALRWYEWRIIAVGLQDRPLAAASRPRVDRLERRASRVSSIAGQTSAPARSPKREEGKSFVGTLFIVATPIGNLGDMTFRAVETLRNVALIAAEDTRHSSILLQEFGITTHMISYHQHNQASRESRLLRELETGDVALISDAGTPGIADPGVEIVAQALNAGHRVVPIPGASAMTAAVSASGIVSGPFLFVGFLPRAGENRRVAIGKAAAAGVPFVVYEAPTRLLATLADMRGMTGNRHAMVARELTKMHEELRAGTLDGLLDHFGTTPLRGEFVIVVGAPDDCEAEGGDVEAVIRQLLADGARPSRAAREASAITGLSGSDAYELVRRVARGAAREKE